MTEFLKEETSIDDIYLTIKNIIQFMFKKKKLFLISFVFIFFVKFLTFYITPDTYLAKMSFVIENHMSSESSSNTGGLSNIGSQFGVNIPGASTGMIDYISSKNLNTFFNSFSLISKVLHTKFNNKSDSTFSQVYSNIYKYDINLSNDEVDRKIYENIIKNEFKIEPIKGSSFLEIKTEMRNPYLSIFFEKTILNQAINEYTILKTGKQIKILEKTQKIVDSITLLLNIKAINNYKKQEELFNSNQAILTNRAIVDQTSRDKQFLLTLYEQVTTQLNSTKMLINQETPYVQILDDIQTPIYSSKNSVLYGMIIAIFTGFFSAIILCTVFYFLRINHNE